MSEHDRAMGLAEKIATKAEDTLAGLEREMAIMKWPADFQKIMWEAVAQAATLRAAECGKGSGT